MPLTWTILRDEKLIHVVADGPVTLRDMEQHFDALVLEDVLAYAKLFDATRLEPVYSEHDMLMLGARLSAYAALDSGPLAIVATREDTLFASKRFLNMASSERPAKMFSTVKKARKWLAAQRAETRGTG
jgi:hypothetical protein